MFARIDRRRKLPVSIILRALGAVPDTAKKNPLEFRGSTEELLNYYYATEIIYIESNTVACILRRRSMRT